MKERLSRKFYLWALGAIAAAYVLAFAKDGLNITEIDLFHHAAFFAFLAAFSFGSSTVFGKRVVNHIDYKLMSALRFGITSLMVFVLLLITGKFLAYDYENIIKEEGGSTNNEKKIIKWLRTQETDKFLMEESKKVLLKKGIYTLLPKKSK